MSYIFLFLTLFQKLYIFHKTNWMLLIFYDVLGNVLRNFFQNIVQKSQNNLHFITVKNIQVTDKTKPEINDLLVHVIDNAYLDN